ncbi:MAG TPA: penicillin acylase family protein, partial [Planctomycetota bacterium]|nr:penicillin acylase family protein [Planctomycetota bacterium]
RGACLPGTANFLVGSTPAQAWGVTALGLDQSDLFRLTVDLAGHPGRYFVDGVWRPFANLGIQVVTVKGAPGLNASVAVGDSDFGPVVTAIVSDCTPEPAIGVGSGCTSGGEYACRAVPFALDDQDAFQGYMSMYRATDLTAFLQATEKLIWPSMNMLVASSSGSIGYIAAGVCPVRKADEFLAGLIALDGDTASNDWQAYLPNHLKPWVIDPSAEFLVSANHRPIGSWYPFSSLYPNIGDSLRSWRLREVLESTTSFTPATFRGLHQDRVLPSAREITLIGAYLRDRTTFQLSSLALTALRSLVPWVNAGAQMDAEHGGVALAHFLRRSSRRDWASPALLAKYGAGEAGLSLFLRTVKAKISASPPLSLTSEESGAIDFLLADAQRKLPAAAAASLRAMADWYTQNFLVGSTAPGTGAPFVYGQQLEGAGAWDPNLTFAFGPLLATDPSTNCSQKGDSYSQFVRPSLTDGAESILPLGISEHPSAPEFTNQKAAWEAARLKPSPTTLPGVQALGPTQTTVLSHP